MGAKAGIGGAAEGGVDGGGKAAEEGVASRRPREEKSPRWFHTTKIRHWNPRTKREEGEGLAAWPPLDQGYRGTGKRRGRWSQRGKSKGRWFQSGSHERKRV